MTAAFTILLPHKRNSGNDEALNLCLDMLFANTSNEFKLLIDAAYDSPLYPRVNAMARQVDTEYFVYWASDFFAAPAWDVPMLEAAAPDVIVTNVLVEPGAIYPHEMNLLKDFGRKPSTFRRGEFEEWSQTDQAPMLSGKGWYAPYLINTNSFLEHGGIVDNLYPDDQGFSAGDEMFFRAWEASGKRVQRVRSFTYHLQRFSVIEEQTAAKRN